MPFRHAVIRWATRPPCLVEARDFERFDYVIAMDEGHYKELRRICPGDARERVRLFLEFAPHTGRKSVPDPYYGDTRGFDAMAST
ncbi:MAG: hypothetical protein U5L06_00280 [Rhodovibrio sp.]|nr:hypothetical protein [Rhodovibrio sp.]